MIPAALIKPLVYVVLVLALIGGAWFAWHSWLSAHDAAVTATARVDWVQQSALDAANARAIKAQQEATFNAQQAVQARQQAAQAAQDKTDALAELQAKIDADVDPDVSRWTKHDIERLQHR